MAQEQANGSSQAMNNAWGYFQKDDFRFRGGFSGTLLLEKVRGGSFTVFTSAKIFLFSPVLQSTSVLKRFVQHASLRRVVNKLFLAVFTLMREGFGESQSSGD